MVAVIKTRLKLAGWRSGLIRIIALVFLITTNFGICSWHAPRAIAGQAVQMVTAHSTMSAAIGCGMVPGKCHMAHCHCCKMNSASVPASKCSECACCFHSRDMAGLYMSSFRDISEFEPQLLVLPATAIESVIHTAEPAMCNSISPNIPFPPPRSRSISLLG